MRELTIQHRAVSSVLPAVIIILRRSPCRRGDSLGHQRRRKRGRAKALGGAAAERSGAMRRRRQQRSSGEWSTEGNQKKSQQLVNATDFGPTNGQHYFYSPFCDSGHLCLTFFYLHSILKKFKPEILRVGLISWFILQSLLLAVLPRNLMFIVRTRQAKLLGLISNKAFGNRGMREHM